MLEICCLPSCGFFAWYTLLRWVSWCRGEKLPSPADLIDTVRDVVADLGLTIVIEPVRRSRLST